MAFQIDRLPLEVLRARAKRRFEFRSPAVAAVASSLQLRLEAAEQILQIRILAQSRLQFVCGTKKNADKEGNARASKTRRKNDK